MGYLTTDTRRMLEHCTRHLLSDIRFLIAGIACQLIAGIVASLGSNPPIDLFAQQDDCAGSATTKPDGLRYRISDGLRYRQWDT